MNVIKTRPRRIITATMLTCLWSASPGRSEEAAPLPPAAETKVARRPDPWQPLRAFVGQWEGEVSGEPGTGKVKREYGFVLNDRFLRVSNQSTYPPQPKNPKGEVHEDVGYFSHDRARKKLVLRQFHIEGFANQYELEKTSDDARTLTFVTTAIENIPEGYRARETYQFTGADEFTETFEMAEPGKDFAVYSQTHFRRKK